MKKAGTYTQGVVYIVLAYVCWGVLPLFWKQLDSVPAVDILAHRVLWSSVLMIALCLFFKRAYLKKYFSSAKSLLGLTLTGVIVTVNWGIFIYAVNMEQVVETGCLT
jgi:chloramphenicol-sensitive protein RarD